MLLFTVSSRYTNNPPEDMGGGEAKRTFSLWVTLKIGGNFYF